MQPIAGQCVTLGLRLRAYVGLVEWTGKHLRPDKRGALPSNAPSVLTGIEANPERWAVRVSAIGSGYWRVIGSAADLLDAANRLQQRWIKGIGLARALEHTG